ncbi:MAG: fumarylacetoacetate hydrolase family protein [Alphaproteobacteria bacterium]|nr:fumarylacetoacetate hydrolase family protein [Alphaproteobacteria bacterium]
MKLASYKAGRDGQLMIVSADLTKTIKAHAAPTLQAALDEWDKVAPQLEAEYKMLIKGEAENILAFDAAKCAAPLPRAYQWADGSAYVNHVELVRKARGAVMPDSFWTDPLIYQGGSDKFIGPQDDIEMPDDDNFGIDMEAEWVAITNEVPMGATLKQAEQSICLLMLVNDVSLRGLIPAELAKGFGFFQSKPSSAFSPVAVTIDELGTAWQDGKLCLPMCVDYNGQAFGRAEAGEDMTFNMPTLIAHAAKTRPLGAGTIIGSGTVSNRDKKGGPGKPIDEGGRGYSCIAELRMVETILHGQAKTPFMKFGDRVKIDMLDADDKSIFGAIDQQVTQYKP